MLNTVFKALAIVALVVTSAGVVRAEESSTLYFFYSPTCPHCHKEATFLDGIEERYPTLRVERLRAATPENRALMETLAEEHGVSEYLGSVPLTFVGEYHFLGYASDETSGREIERAIESVLGATARQGTTTADTRAGSTTGTEATPEKTLTLPLVGIVRAGDYPFVVLAALLGFLDGFNVCSLGALSLIIALVLTQKSRRLVTIMGGVFLLTTGLSYGLLIGLWHGLFAIVGAYVPYLTGIVGVIALAGALYFAKEYLRMLREGPTCSLPSLPYLTRITQETQQAFASRARLGALAGATALFALVVTIVEFPCSAAVPLVFAGMLADAGVTQIAAYGYIGIFTLFYLLDELALFAFAAWRLRLMGASPRAARSAVLIEALILAGLGLWYVGTSVGLV